MRGWERREVGSKGCLPLSNETVFVGLERRPNNGAEV